MYAHDHHKPAIIFTISISIMDSLSVMLIIIVGQRPAAERVAVSVAIIMSRLVIGSANIFVMMKYFGKVPKYNHATGPVKI